MSWRTRRNGTKNGKQRLIACRERQWKPVCTTAISFPKVAGTSESRFSGCAGRLRPDPNAVSRHLAAARRWSAAIPPKVDGPDHGGSKQESAGEFRCDSRASGLPGEWDPERLWGSLGGRLRGPDSVH